MDGVEYPGFHRPPAEVVPVPLLIDGQEEILHNVFGFAPITKNLPRNAKYGVAVPIEDHRKAVRAPALELLDQGDVRHRFRVIVYLLENGLA